MGSGGNAAGSGATQAGAVACTHGPQFIEGKPTGAQGRPRPEHRKRRASTARSASGNRYREQRTVAGNGTGRQPGSRVRAHGKPCGRCRGEDMSTPQKCPSTRHYLRATPDNRYVWSPGLTVSAWYGTDVDLLRQLIVSRYVWRCWNMAASGLKGGPSGRRRRPLTRWLLTRIWAPARTVEGNS